MLCVRIIQKKKTLRSLVKKNNMLKEKIITIHEPTNLNPAEKTPIKFKDENDDKYILWKTSNNEDGSKRESKAYGMYKELQFSGEGQTVGIVYKEEPASFTNQQGKLINYTNRTVVMLKDPSQVRPENQTPNIKAQEAPSKPYVNERYNNPNHPINSPQANTGRDTEAEGKVRHGVAIAYIAQGKGLNDISAKEISDWTNFIMTGKTNKPVVNNNAVVDDMPVDSIPF